MDSPVPRLERNGPRVAALLAALALSSWTSGLTSAEPPAPPLANLFQPNESARLEPSRAHELLHQRLWDLRQEHADALRHPHVRPANGTSIPQPPTVPDEPSRP